MASHSLLLAAASFAQEADPNLWGETSLEAIATELSQQGYVDAQTPLNLVLPSSPSFIFESPSTNAPTNSADRPTELNKLIELVLTQKRHDHLQATLDAQPKGA